MQFLAVDLVPFIYDVILQTFVLASYITKLLCMILISKLHTYMAMIYALHSILNNHACVHYNLYLVL